jgi:hypothetical protein
VRSKLLFGSGLAGLGLSGTSCAGTLPMKASARTCVPIQSGKLCVSVASAAADFIPESVADLLRNQQFAIFKHVFGLYRDVRADFIRLHRPHPFRVHAAVDCGLLRRPGRWFAAAGFSGVARFGGPITNQSD